jgi:uncharacterized protein (DUF736 family)
MEYDNTNSGAAFPKDNPNPKAPKYAGPLNVEGKDFEISIWEKTSKAGKPFLSIKVGPPREKKPGNSFNAHNKAKGNGYQPQDEDIDF